MEKIEFLGMFIINVLMWGIAVTDPRGISHFTTALVAGSVFLLLIPVLSRVAKKIDGERNPS